MQATAAAERPFNVVLSGCCCSVVAVVHISAVWYTMLLLAHGRFVNFKQSSDASKHASRTRCDAARVCSYHATIL